MAQSSSPAQIIAENLVQWSDSPFPQVANPTIISQSEAIIHALSEAGLMIVPKEVYPPITDDQSKKYTFIEWITASLIDIDPDIIVQSAGSGVDLIEIKLNAVWPIATIQAPATNVLSAWMLHYPREVQTEIFRRLVFAINSWYHLSTFAETGRTV